jgi:hypothetical protein
MNVAALAMHPKLMASLELQLLPSIEARFHAEAVRRGLKPNWSAVLAWAEKYVPALFWPAVMDVIAGNWGALLALAATQGAQCVMDLLAALGVVG